MSLNRHGGREGSTKLYPRELRDFQTIESAIIPGDMAYLLVDIDRGKESRNITPGEARKRINRARQAISGWRWEGNPYTELGSASCGGRVGLGGMSQA